MIFHVFANKSNIGDWVSALAIQSLLRPHRVVECLCDEPFVPGTLATLSSATPDDVIVIGGGGLFMDYFVPFWQDFLELARRTRFCLWGVGYCDVKRDASHPPMKLIEMIVSLSQICVVRDELTRAYLRDCPMVKLVPCPALSYFTQHRPGRGLLHVDAYDDVGPELYSLMNSVGADFATRTDRPFARINNRISANSKPQLNAALDAYRAADLILTGRLHGCILGLAMGRKVLAVSGAHKIESFMQAAGLGEWVLDANTAGSLEDRLNQLTNQVAPLDFLEQARRGNLEVARRVQALAGT